VTNWVGGAGWWGNDECVGEEFVDPGVRGVGEDVSAGEPGDRVGGAGGGSGADCGVDVYAEGGGGVCGFGVGEVGGGGGG
jgi:hypothetical protein